MNLMNTLKINSNLWKMIKMYKTVNMIIYNKTKIQQQRRKKKKKRLKNLIKILKKIL